MPQTVAEHAASELRAVMARQSVTQQQMATRLGIPQSQVSKRLRGLVPWRLDELAAAAEFLGITVSSLIEDAA